MKTDHKGIRLFPHRDSFILCVVHSLATYIVVQPSVTSGDQVFPRLAESKSVCAYANCVYRQCYDYAQLLHKSNLQNGDDLSTIPFAVYTSHCLRYGCAQLLKAQGFSDEHIRGRGLWKGRRESNEQIYLDQTRVKCTIIDTITSMPIKIYIASQCILINRPSLSSTLL